MQPARETDRGRKADTDSTDRATHKHRGKHKRYKHRLQTEKRQRVKAGYRTVQTDR